MSELAGRRVLVVGLARAGTAASHALLHAGATVVGFDSNEMLDAGRLRAEGVEVHLGREEETLLQGIDLVVKSPGVRGDAPLVAGARARGIPVWDELELGARLLPNPILAVTGTNGKTTTTALLGEILSSGGRSVAVAGNIGRALSSLVGGIEPDTWIVCEVGVFQLDDMEIFHPRIAVLVNLEADHLDRYGDQETYAETKLRLFRLQTENDVAVVPRGFGPVPGAARRVEFAADDPLPAEPTIPGLHNRENAAAATLAARAVGISDEDIARALRSFRGVEHRIENVATIGGVRFVNDSKATNVAAALRALASFPDERLHVILGGRGKNESYAPLASAFRPDGRAYLVGEAADEIATELASVGVAFVQAGNLENAVREAFAAANSRRHRAALSRVRELRPVQRLRGARRCVPRPRGGVVLRGDGHADQRLVAFLTLGLVAFGLVMVYSATSASAALGNGDPMSFLKRQAVYALIGVVFMTLAARFDYHRLRYLAPPLVVIALVLCVAVLVLGPAINGARRWFIVGPASFQPSELAKLALCLFAATYLARRRAPRTFGELMKPLGALTLIFGGLIVVEPDLGTTITLCGMMLAIFLVAGVPARLLVGASAVAVGLGLLAIWIEPYRRARVFSFLDPWSDAQGAGFQIVQATIGIGSGGFTGAGLGEGVGKVSYLPEAHTDMIFAVIGEELGLIGATFVICAFALLAITGFRIALRCRDPFGKLLAAGITSLVCGQAAINLAAALGIAPLTGIPLPFVSYGGSSLVVLLTGMGVLLNIAVNERVARASVRDRGGRDGRTRPARARSRRGASRTRSDGDVRRVARPRRVAARS